MTRLRERMSIDMSIAGLSANTQKSYRTAVVDLCKHYGGKPPGKITENELKAFFIHLKDERGLAKATLRQKYSAVGSESY